MKLVIAMVFLAFGILFLLMGIAVGSAGPIGISAAFFFGSWRFKSAFSQECEQLAAERRRRAEWEAGRKALATRHKEAAENERLKMIIKAAIEEARKEEL